MVKIFEYFVVYLLPILTFIFQMYGEHKREHQKEDVSQVLNQNNVNFDFDNNNGQITVNQTINDTSLEKEIQSYNKEVANLKFYSSLLLKISGYIVFAIILFNISYQVVNRLDAIKSAPIFSVSTEEVSVVKLVEEAFLTASPYIYKQLLLFISLFLAVNALKWCVRTFKRYKYSLLKFIYYSVLAIIYWVDSRSDFFDSINIYSRKIQFLFGDSSVTYTTLIFTVVLVMAIIYISDIVINRFFDLVKSEKESERENQIINLRDNGVVLFISIVIYLIMNYKG